MKNNLRRAAYLLLALVMVMSMMVSMTGCKDEEEEPVTELLAYYSGGDLYVSYGEEGDSILVHENASTGEDYEDYVQIQRSHDGKGFYYLAEAKNYYDARLFYIGFDELATCDGKGGKFLVDHVNYYYEGGENNNFIVYSDKDYELCVYNKETGKDVTVEDEFAYWETMGDYLIFTTAWDEEKNGHSLCTVNMNEPNKVSTIDKCMQDIIKLDADNEKIYYSTWEKSEPEEFGFGLGSKNALYVTSVDGKPELIEDGLESVWITFGDIFYVKPKVTGQISYYDCIEDDKLETDEGLQEPAIEDYSVEFEDDTQNFTTTNWTAYYVAQDEYDAKVERDKVREELKKHKMDTGVFQLYSYDGKSKLVCDSLEQLTHWEEYLTYSESQEKSGDVKLSVNLTLTDAMEMTEEAYDDIRMWAYQKGEDVDMSGTFNFYMDEQGFVEIDGAKADLGDYCPFDDENGNLIIFTASSELDSYPVKNGKLGEKVEIAHKADAIEYVEEGKIYFATREDFDEGTGDINVWDGKVAARVAKDVNLYTVWPDNGNLLFLDVNDTLYRYADDQTTEIAKKVEYKCMLNQDKVIYKADDKLFGYDIATATEFLIDRNAKDFTVF